MPPPTRDNYAYFKDLERRIETLERTITIQQAIVIADSTTVPPAPASGGLFYVAAGVLHYRGPSTNTTVAPA